jgi:hypothetical protein
MEDTRFWTDWQQAHSQFDLAVIYSRMQFWSVTVVSKYLKFAIFSNDFVMILTCILVARQERTGLFTFFSVYF